MYTIIIAISSGILIGSLSYFVPYLDHWGISITIALIVSIISLIILSRKVMKRLEPLFVQAQKHAQSRNFKMAIETLQAILPMSKWQVMLKSQIYSQMGVIYYAEKKEDQALECLQQGSMRAADAQMILAGIHYRRKDMDKMKTVFDTTLKVNKKQMILYNAYAYMLNAIGENEKAIEILQKGLKVNAENDVTKDNLLRLQNGKKMNMKAFGMPWYSLQLEKPPKSMIADQFAGRAGFRQKRMRGR